jgi:multiple sugar transport system substrate-binding protein
VRGSSVLAVTLTALAGCAGGGERDGPRLVTFSGSVVGAEAQVLANQLDAFMAANPDLRVEVQGTPDAADQRHQLYVQWLNARTSDPDILQLDVVWTPEFAAAGWILPLDRYGPEVDAFFTSTVTANRWQDRLHAVPWFVDVGLLYWRTDLLDQAPATYAQLAAEARRAMDAGNVPFGFVWQGARYEGLVTVFLEHTHAFGGAILDEAGRVALADEPAVQALTFMRNSLHGAGITPAEVLTWQEEQARFAFQNGEAALMRNWPYAAALLAAPDSRVAGSFAVAPLPAGPGGSRASALGGQQLAINAHTEHPDDAWRVVEFLTSEAQMLERALAAGHYPARVALYQRPELGEALQVAPEDARIAIESAVPRPVTPAYTELSRILQVWIHRALSRQAEPRAALEAAAREANTVLARMTPPPAPTP